MLDWPGVVRNTFHLLLMLSILGTLELVFSLLQLGKWFVNPNAH